MDPLSSNDFKAITLQIISELEYNLNITRIVYVSNEGLVLLFTEHELIYSWYVFSQYLWIYTTILIYNSIFYYFRMTNYSLE